jgi:lipopolysaccharide transport protein LptA
MGGGLSMGVAMFLAVAGGAAPDAGVRKANAPIRVTCDDMVVQNRNQAARCQGHVKAVRLLMTITCDRALAHYDDTGAVTDLTCIDHVKVVEKDRVATGDRGYYDEAKRTVEMTGHALLVQGDDRLTGEPIIFYVDDDRVVAKHAKLRGHARDLTAEHRAMPDAGTSVGGERDGGAPTGVTASGAEGGGE